jgi:hypothetical protein
MLFLFKGFINVGLFVFLHNNTFNLFAKLCIQSKSNF